ncbi:MAG: hypothetical protein GY929_23780 [Actinomycetia bacterium]|nr:hypothetical protein [Actinomycetes bacterium]
MNRRTRQMVIVGLAAVVTALGLLILVSRWAGGNDDNGFEIRLGDDRFDAGGAEARARTIEGDGPLFFADLVTGDRPIVLHHLDPDPSRGWYAFVAVAPGTDDCVLTWSTGAFEFTDCTGAVWPADGTGLDQFPVTIEDGSLIIDLNASDRDPDDAG